MIPLRYKRWASWVRSLLSFARSAGLLARGEGQAAQDSAAAVLSSFPGPQVARCQSRSRSEAELSLQALGIEPGLVRSIAPFAPLGEMAFSCVLPLAILVKAPL